MVVVPPRLSVVVVPTPLVNVPPPDKVVPTVRVPVLVKVPVTATLPIEVMVDPLIVFPAPLKVCTPVPKASNVKALFVRLPANVNLSVEPFPVAGTVQTALLFRVTLPVNVITRAVPELESMLIVPDMFVVVVTVKLRVSLRVDPLLMTRVLHVALADIVTSAVPA